MGYHLNIKEILISGGVTLALLIVLSIYSIALMWERWRFYSRATAGQKGFLDKVRRIMKEGDPSEAVSLCRSYQGMASAVVLSTLVGPKGRDQRKGSAQRATERALSRLQARLSALATIASVSPFIGLFGTVIGVMRAFRDLAGAAGAGPGVVAIGISEALVCTATGLFVAIPALAAYNHFSNRAARFADEMAWISDEILEDLTEKARQ